MAVLELEAKGADPVEVSVITEELRLCIVELGRFTLLERKRIEDILKEQEFSVSDCTTDECYVHMGRLLSVHKMVAGQVGKVGSIYSIYARIIDVESGEVSAIRRAKARRIDELYEVGVPKVVEGLFNTRLSRAGGTTSKTIGDMAKVLRDAGEAYAQHEWDQALGLYQRLQEVDPENPLVKERIADCERRATAASDQRDFENWKTQTIRDRLYYLQTAKQLLEQDRTKEAGKYALLSLAGDWEWPVGRSMLRDVMQRAGWRAREGCDVAGAFEALDLPDAYKSQLKKDAERICQEIRPGKIATWVSEDGATVLVDGEVIGVSPLEPVEVDAGEHELRVEMDGFEAKTRTVNVSPGGTIRADIKLKRTAIDPGVLIVEVSESDADVRVGRRRLGKSPVSASLIEPGEHELKVTKAGYQEQTRNIRIAPGDTSKAFFDLEPLSSPHGFITLRVSEDDAQVILDWKTIGTTPLPVSAVEPGNHRIEVKKGGFKDRKETFSVTQGDTVALELVLKSKFGALTVTSEPESARVLVDRKFVGISPLCEVSVSEGRRVVAVEKDGYQRWTQSIDVIGGEKVTLSAVLTERGTTRVGVLTRSMVFPGWGQRYLGARTRGTVLTMLFLSDVALYVGARSKNDADKYPVDFYRIMAGIIWSANVLDALTAPLGEERVVSICPDPQTRSVAALVSLRIP
jgi:hypothetical protein